MNVENILKVADAIEQHSILDLGFNMEDWIFYGKGLVDRSGHNCGTTACIAGWAVCVIDPQRDRELDGVWEEAEIYFGIKGQNSSDLFLGMPQRTRRDKVSTTQAVRTLRHLAATGEVNWDLPAA